MECLNLRHPLDTYSIAMKDCWQVVNLSAYQSKNENCLFRANIPPKRKLNGLVCREAVIKFSSSSLNSRLHTLCPEPKSTSNRSRIGVSGKTSIVTSPGAAL